MKPNLTIKNLEEIKDQEVIRLFLGFISRYLVLTGEYVLTKFDLYMDCTMVSQCYYDPNSYLLHCSKESEVFEDDKDLDLELKQDLVRFTRTQFVTSLYIDDVINEDKVNDKGFIRFSTEFTNFYLFKKKFKNNEPHGRFIIKGEVVKTDPEIIIEPCSEFLYQLWCDLNPLITELSKMEDMLIDGKLIALKKAYDKMKL